jgi:hypothetical protein
MWKETIFSLLCLCVPEFQDTSEPLIYTFLRTDEKLCKLQESAGNAKIISLSLTLNWNTQQMFNVDKL